MNAHATNYALQFRQFAAMGQPAISEQATDYRLKNLLRFVRDHDCATDAAIQDGAIWATAYWRDADNIEHSEWQKVGTNLNECRIWLGY